MIKNRSWLALSLLVLAGPALAPARAAEPAFKKVMIVVLENMDYDVVMKQPFFAGLASRGALLEDYHGLARPSQPNYIGLVSGSLHGVDSNGSYDLDARHVGDLLEARGKSWKAYAEDYPGECFLGKSSGQYVRKHLPFISFTNVQRDPARCRNVVNASVLEAEIRQGTLPDYSLYVPNQLNNGHDTDPSYANRWLERAFGPRLDDPRFMDGMLLVITFDEGGLSQPGNHVYTVLYGSSVVAGARQKARYDHYSLLRTVEDAMGLGTLGLEDAKASAIEGVWQ